MSLFDTIRTANHNLFRNKVRTLLTILAIFVGSFTIILNIAINTGVNQFIDDQTNMIGGEDYLVIMNRGSANSMANTMGGSEIQEYSEDNSISEITDEDIEKLKNLDGIDGDSVEPRGNGVSIDYIKGTKNDKRFQVNTGAGTMPPGNFTVPMTAGEIPDPDTKEDLIALEAGYPKALGYDSDDDIIGQTVILGIKDPVTGEFQEFKVKVAGVQASGVVAFNGNAVTRQLESKLKHVTEQYYPAGQKTPVYSLQARFDLDRYSEDEIKQLLEDNGFYALTVSDIMGMMRTFFDAIMIVFTIFGGIALLAAAIGIVNTLLMSVEERTREIGLDKALGMSSGRVFCEFAVEAISLGFWGSAVGVVIAVLIGSFANTAVHAPGGFLEELPTFNLFSFTPGNIIPLVLIIMFIAFIAGTIPAWKAAHKNPIDALRYE